MEYDKIMVDTSVWIDFFKSGKSSASKLLVKKLEEDKVCICGIIELELIQGLKENEKIEVMNCLEILEYIELTKEYYRSAGRTISDLRKKGITVAPADALIATLCIRNNLTLLSFDKDYKHFPALNKKIF
jgi:hypothetical protein